MSKAQFRFLIVADWVLTIVVAFFHFVSRRSWPGELQAWFNSYNHDPQYQLSTLRLILALLYLITFFIISVGLFFFKRWARTILIPSTLLGLILISTSRISIDVEWVVSIKSGLSTLFGFLIAVAYFSPVSKAFEKI